MFVACSSSDKDQPASPGDDAGTADSEEEVDASSARASNVDSTANDEDRDAAVVTAGEDAAVVVQAGSSLDPTENVSDAAAPDACQVKNGIKILFTPAYSAYDGEHSFKVPMVVSGVDPSQVEWATSDDTKVRHTRDDSFGGELFETTGSGDVTIFAAIGNVCGYSVLHITEATPAQWQKGSDRYHNGAFVMRLGEITRPDSTTRTIDCTNCHGVKDTSTNSLGTVQHTPMQTAGFSDVDLKSIFTMGVTPTGTLAQPISNLTYATWHAFHQWVMVDDDEANGVIVYLRSIAPAPTGNADFGGVFGMMGRGNFDGGFGPLPEGGFPNRRDGGF
jgi:hypothetical protein